MSRSKTVGSVLIDRPYGFQSCTLHSAEFFLEFQFFSFFLNLYILKIFFPQIETFRN